MTALAAPSALRLPGATARRRNFWSVAWSVLLHMALLALIILGARQRQRLPEYEPPAPVAMVFESGGKTLPSIANPAAHTPKQQGSPEQVPTTPPATPPAPPAPRTAPQVVPPSQPPAPTPPLRPITPPVTPPAPSPPPLAPTEQAPASAAPAAHAPAPEAVPLPPPVPPPVPRTAPSREATARPLARPHPQPAFPAPMDFSLQPNAAPQAAAPPRRAPSRGTIDLSFAPSLGGGDITQFHPQGKGDDVGSDWLNEVSAWWIRHRFYPDEAARLNQQGEVTLHLRVAQSGKVEAVHVEEGSGSPWLDMAALAVFRDANLPPLPGDMRDPDIDVNFVIHYEIVH